MTIMALALTLDVRGEMDLCKQQLWLGSSQNAFFEQISPNTTLKP
jgi:hypothetical protein